MFLFTEARCNFYTIIQVYCVLQNTGVRCKCLFVHYTCVNTFSQTLFCEKHICRPPNIYMSKGVKLCCCPVFFFFWTPDI